MRQMLSYFDIARREVIILLACQTMVGLKMSVSFLFVLKRTLETVVVLYTDIYPQSAQEMIH